MKLFIRTIIIKPLNTTNSTI